MTIITQVTIKGSDACLLTSNSQPTSRTTSCNAYLSNDATFNVCRKLLQLPRFKHVNGLLHFNLDWEIQKKITRESSGQASSEIFQLWVGSCMKSLSQAIRAICVTLFYLAQENG